MHQPHNKQPLRLCRLALISISIILCSKTLYATQYYAVSNGTWLPGFATSNVFNVTGCSNPVAPNLNPGQLDLIEVCSGDTLTVGGSGSIGGLLIDTNGVVILNPGLTLSIYGTYTNYGTIYGGGKVVQYFSKASAASQWTAPAGVDTVDVEAWGGGGGGGSAGSAAGPVGAGGGSGGAYAISTGLPVTPGATYTFTVGSGGAGGSASGSGSDGATGTDSWFSNTSTAGISNQPANSSQGAFAKAGTGGKKPVVLNTGGAGAIPVLHALDNSSGGSYGSLIYIGGYGANAGNSGKGGGGGSSGGTAADGDPNKSGVVQSYGGSVIGGGTGGSGGYYYNNGTSGGSPGGGGGGSGRYRIDSIPTPPYKDTTFFAGGSGGDGQIGIGFSTAGNAPPGCIPPKITSCPPYQSVSSCTSTSLSYYAPVTGSTPTVMYGTSGWSTTSGNGTGSGTTFDVGYTSVTIVASNACGSATCQFDVSISQPPTYSSYPLTYATADPGTCTYTIYGTQFDYYLYGGCYAYTSINDLNNSTSLSGTVLPVGTTMVTWSTYYNGWLLSTDVFYITVVGDRTINASAGTGGTISPSWSNTVSCGADTTFTITPNPCYRIADVLVDGISVGAVSSYTFTNVIADHTISASFVPETYPVTVTQNTGGTISPGTTTINCGASQTFLISPDPCYQLTDVLVNGISVGNTTSYTFSNITSPQSISAVFTLIKYSVTATATAGGTISPPGVTSIACGLWLTYNFTPDPCYHLDYLLVNGNVVTPRPSFTFYNISGDASIHAVFAPDTFLIGVVQTTGGTISPYFPLYAKCGSNEPFTITPDPCYQIDNVYVNGSPIGPVTSYTFTNVQSPQMITASFTPMTYIITALPATGGVISPSPVTTLNCNSTQTITITADPCYQISDVQVDGISVGAVSSYTFNNISSDHIIGATFTPLNYNLSVIQTANGTISPGSTTVSCNGGQTFSITADPCYHIVDVIVDGSSQGAISTYTFSNVNNDHSITAQYAPDLFPITVTQSPNGNISPSSTNSLCGSNEIFSITADACYMIADVWVDNVSVGAVSSYTFTNIQAAHTITASFVPDASQQSTAATSITSDAPGNILCQGPNVNFMINGGSLGVGASWVWYEGGCGNGTSVGNGTTQFINQPAAGTHDYFVRAEGTCNSTSCVPVSITVNPLPTTAVTTSGATTFCQGSTVDLFATGGVSYQWYVNGFAIPGATSNTLSGVNFSGSFSVSITADANGCAGATASSPVNVVVNSLPVVTLTAPTAVCMGTAYTVSAQGANTYSWTPSFITGNSSSITPANAGTDYYTVTGTDLNNCSGTASTAVIVNSLPAVQISQPVTICNSQPVTLTASGAVNYTWDNNAAGASVSVTPAATTCYTVTASDANNCSSTANTCITVLQSPTVDAGKDFDGCVGSDVMLNAKLTANPNNISYQWTPSAGLSDATVLNPTLLTSTPGVYTYVLSLSSAASMCPSSSDTVSITLHNTPALIAFADSTDIFGGQQAHITTTAHAMQYQWSPPFGLSCTDCPNPVASPKQTTAYQVMIIDSFGCRNEATVQINVDEAVTLYVPNAFTPHGNNPVFKASGVGITEIEFDIFNRLGEMIFQTNDLYGGWDGTYKGNTAEDGTYVWMIRATSFKGEVVTRTGSVSLIN